MINKGRHITLSGYKKIHSFVKSIFLLCLVVLLFPQNNLLAQVINNTGAAISVSGAVVGSKDLENSSGTLGNNGTITLSGNYFNQGTTNGNGYYNLRGQWTNYGSFIPGTSTVTLYGTVNQTINNNSSGETFYNLIINNPGSVITQIANAGSTLGVLNNLTLTVGTLSLHSSTTALSVGGKATINGSLIFNSITTQTTTIGDILSGSGIIDMSWGNLPHLLNLAGATNAIGTFTTSPTGASTVNYNGTGPTQTVFAAPNYRNLMISNSGIKTLQGSSVVGINLTINGGTFDLGTSATTLDVAGNTSITGSMSFNGTTDKIVTLNGSLSGAGGIDMSGGNLQHLLNLNGTSNTIGSYLSGTGSTVKYTLDGDQSVFSSDNYRNLAITGTGVKTIYSDISASGILTMSAGDINSNGNTLKITNPSLAAIVRTGGTVIGKLQRAIGTRGSDYLYPIGTVTFYNPLKIRFDNLTSGPLTAQFLPDDIGTVGLPLDDDDNEIFDRYTTGYWSLTSVSPMNSGDYSVNLNYTGFPGGIDQSASIIKRTDGGSLEIDGAHGIISSPEITRDTLKKGISSTTTDLAIGKGRPRIVRQPDNIDVCDSTNAFFEVTARGRGTLTYQWQVSINGGTTFSNVIDGGVYSGATTKKLTLTGAVYSMNQYLYRCIITDAQGHPNTTIPALLTVNKIPVATASPTSQNECPGVAFTNILLGTSNDVPGTTFQWSRSAPSGITTNLPLTGSATGDMITGTFTNTTDSPVTVIFNIIPTGPATTFCIGHQISVSVTVNPKPKVLAAPPNTIQCDSTTTSIRLTSPSIFTSGVIKFKYTVTTTGDAGSVTGFISPTSDIAKDAFITDKLINHTDVYQIVTYRVVPVSPVGCIDGDALEVKVTVNPTPRVVPVIQTPEICYGGMTNVVLTTPTVMTSGVIKFDYTISFTGVPGDVTGNSASASDLTPGQTLAFQYWNSAPPSRIDTVSSVLFAVRPKVVGLGCNAGRINTAEVKVHPKTIKYNYPATNEKGILITKPLTCDKGSGLAALKVILTTGADPYLISWTGPVSYSNDSVEIRNLNIGKYTVSVTDNIGCNNNSSENIVPKTAIPQILPTVILPNIHVTCPGGNDGSITVKVSSGQTAPYYFWVMRINGTSVDTLFNGVFTSNFVDGSDPNTYKVYNNLKAGTYMITIRDVNGCIIPRTTELKEPAPITNLFQTSKEINNGYDVSCLGYNNGYAIAQTTGGNGTYSYLWYPVSGTLNVSTNTNMLDSVSAGKYYLRTTDLMGCVKVDSVILTEPPGMVLTGSVLSVKPDGVSNISCNGGNDGSIQITISGGSGEYLYSWTSSNGFTANTKDISELKAGVYTCNVSDVNGCVLIDPPSFTLVEPAPLVITGTPSKSDDGSFNINCNGSTGAINISVAGGSLTGYSYAWSTSDGSGIIAGQKDQPSLTIGTYVLKVTDLNGCETQAEYSLTQPPAFELVLSATDITCQAPGFNNGSIDLSVSGGVAPYSYSWSNGSSDEDITGLTEGYYYITVTYNNTCSKRDSVRINKPPLLTYTRSLSDYNGYNISCNGLINGSIQINPTSGLAPFIYNWTGPDGFSATSQNLSNRGSGDYTLLITDSNYCTATETITLTEPGKLGMVINLSESTAGGFNLNCAGDTTGFISIEPLNQVKTVDYMWSDGLFGKTRINLTAGNYSVIIKDGNNCYASSTITLTEPDSLKLEFDISKPLCPDMPDGEIRLKVTGGVPGTDYTYKWSDNSTNKAISNILKGFYKVIIRDLNGCSLRDSVTVDPLNETCLVVPKGISPNDDLINDVWNIGMIELYPNMEIKIFNRWGEIIWRSEKGYPKPWDGKSNGIPLPIDSYHYIIDLHNGTKPIVGNVTIVR